MADIQIVAENLAELLTNTVDMASVFYDIFLNPNPMDVDLKMYDDNNQLITVTIPNRAKDRITPYMGSGSPEGVIAAPIGSTYVDTLTSTVYYKVSGESDDPYGWNAVLSQSLMETFIRTYLEARGYVTVSSLNTYLNTHEYVTKNDAATSDDYGVIKIDDETIKNNADSQIRVFGIADSNETNPVVRNLWVGEETEYETLYLEGDMQDDTIYLLKDVGQLLIGDTEVCCNGFPSNTYEVLDAPTSGDTYTAPTNGWFLFNKTAGIANAKLEMVNTTSNYATTLYLPETTSTGYIACPALRGEVVEVSYTATGITNSFIFINAAANRVTYGS